MKLSCWIESFQLSIAFDIKWFFLFQKKFPCDIWCVQRMNEFLCADLLQIGLNPKMVFNLFLFLQHIKQLIVYLIQFGAPTRSPWRVLSKMIWAWHVLHRLWCWPNAKTNECQHTNTHGFGLWMIMFGWLLSVWVSSLSFAYNRVYAQAKRTRRLTTSSIKCVLYTSIWTRRFFGDKKEIYITARFQQLMDLTRQNENDKSPKINKYSLRFCCLCVCFFSICTEMLEVQLVGNRKGIWIL